MTTITGAILTDSYLSVTIDGKPYTVDSTHPNFEAAKEAYRDKDAEQLLTLVNVPAFIEEYSKGKVSVRDGVVYFGERALHNSLTARMLKMLKEGFDVDPLANFLENLLQNPSHRAVNELYTFLEKCSLPITEDGHFLAYKRVRNDYGSIHASPDGTHMSNVPGAVCEMERNGVDEDKSRTCSYGLHFCSIEYLPQFGTMGPNNNDRVVIVKINPRDVVAIPSDYNDSKGRTCRYEVVDEWCDWETFAAEHKDLFTAPVVSDYSDVDDDDILEEFEDDYGPRGNDEVYEMYEVEELTGLSPDAIRKRLSRGHSMFRVEDGIKFTAAGRDEFGL